MKPIGWHKRRRKAMKTGAWKYGDEQFIKLKMSTQDIYDYIKEKKIDIPYTDVISHLQAKVYVGICPNNEQALKNQIWIYVEDKEKSFPKMYWKEYVSYKTQLIDDYNKVVRIEKDLNKIRLLLDKHPEYHYITGERLQEQYNHTLDGKTMNFSWRAWGQLMAAYMNTKEQERKYDYMSFYM